jgi:hypothetical protein
MASGFGAVPVEAEVAASDGEIGRDSQLLTGWDAEQGAVVADTETHEGRWNRAGAGTKGAEEGKFAGVFRAGRHDLRIDERHGPRAGMPRLKGRGGIEPRCGTELLKFWFNSADKGGKN